MDRIIELTGSPESAYAVFLHVVRNVFNERGGLCWSGEKYLIRKGNPPTLLASEPTSWGIVQSFDRTIPELSEYRVCVKPNLTIYGGLIRFAAAQC